MLPVCSQPKEHPHDQSSLLKVFLNIHLSTLVSFKSHCEGNSMIQAFFESPWPMIIAVLGIALFFGALILAIQVIEEKSKISKRKAYWAGRKQRSGNSKTD